MYHFFFYSMNLKNPTVLKVTNQCLWGFYNPYFCLLVPKSTNISRQKVGIINGLSFHLKKWENKQLSQFNNVEEKYFCFQPQWSNRDKTYLPAWNNNRTRQNTWNNRFQNKGHQEMKDSVPWEIGNNWDEPYEFLSFLPRGIVQAAV